jgi:hypothetical protein
MSSFFRLFLSLGLIAALLPAPAHSADTITPQISEIEGEIVKVVPEEREIYVLSAEKKHEYYFNEKTTVVKGETTAAFEDLKTGMKVKVTANKIGKRLDPTTVKILE